jgi:endonuclease/exonuclease/phosphatase (EEP) superfamily protein YafD
MSFKDMGVWLLALLRSAAAYGLLGIILVGCASLSTDKYAADDWHAYAVAATQTESCRDLLADSRGSTRAELDPRNIRILNWNMQKIRDTDALADLYSLSSDTDLVLIQEAAFRDELLTGERFWSFAPGYHDGAEQTGVMTLSAAAPLSQCNLTNHEPWLGTPKATSITEYALSGTDETLVVINIHAVNFTFGLKDFRAQIEQIPAILEKHSGPVILSGDFNTWRQKRLDVVAEVSERLGLKAIEFDKDERTMAFGMVLDHVYVRGLNKRSASTRAVSTSDHNPMTVSLSLNL